MIWSKAFWKGAGERAIKTFLEVFVPTFLAALGATAEGVLDAWTAPWLVAAQTASGLALGATVISLLISVMNADFTAGAVERDV
jgi:Na+-driven multidrug efflux pump